jgi:hypothetical protein
MTRHYREQPILHWRENKACVSNPKSAIQNPKSSTAAAAY